jgi:hypothetical protein
VREWALLSNFELVPLATYAGYLNLIQLHFWRSPSSWSTTPTTRAESNLASPSPATSAIETAPTKAAGSPSSSGETESPEQCDFERTFREDPLDGSMFVNAAACASTVVLVPVLLSHGSCLVDRMEDRMASPRR